MRNTEKVNVYNLYDIVRKIGFSKLPEEQKFDFKIYAAITRWGTDFSHVLQSDSAQEQISRVLHRFNKYVTDRNILPHDPSSTLLNLSTLDESHLLNNMNDIDGHILPEPARSLFLEFRHRMIYNKRNRYTTADSNKKHLIERLLKTLNQLTKVFGGLPQKDIHHRELAGRVRSNDYRQAKITIYNFPNYVDLFKESGLPFDIDEIKIAHEYFLKKANNRPANIAEDRIGTFGLIRTIGFLNDFGEENGLLNNITETELVTFPADLEDIDFVDYLHRLVPEHFSEDVEQKLKLFYVATIHGSFYEPDAYSPEFQKEFTALKNEIIRASEILEGLELTAHIDRDEDEEEELQSVSNFRRWLINRKARNVLSPNDALGDINLRKSKTGFQYYDVVIHPLRFLSIIKQIDQDQTPFYVGDLIRFYSHYTENGSNTENLLNEPLASLVIKTCCDFINDNFHQDENGDDLNTIKMIMRFIGEPKTDDKIMLLMMVNPEDYHKDLSIRIQLIQYAINQIPIMDFEDIPEVVVKEINSTYDRLTELMKAFNGIPVHQNIEVDGIGTTKRHPNTQLGEVSLAQRFLNEYNSLCTSKQISKSQVNKLLEKTQDMIVNLKIRKTDPAAKDIDTLQRNLIRFLQGKSKVLPPLNNDKQVGLLFGIEPIKRKRETNIGAFSAEKFFTLSNRSLNYAFVTVFDFPEKYRQLEKLQLPFDLEVLHKFYYQNTESGNNPFLLIDNPTARVTILIMLDYINHIASENQNMSHIKPVLVSEFVPDDMSEEEMYEFLQYVVTKRYPKKLADEIEMINYSTSKLLFKDFGDGAPSDLLYASRRIVKELKNVAAHLGGIVLKYENDLSVGVIRKRINKREQKRQKIAGQFAENAINSICAGKSKEEAAHYLINELQKIARDKQFHSENARSAIDRVVADLKQVAKKKGRATKKSVNNSNLAGWISNTIEFENKVTDQVKPVMSVQEAADLPINEIPFNGLLHQLFGRPELGFTTMMYGAPGSGKSTLCLWLAKQLALNHGKVLYVTAEQYPKGSLTSLINRMNMASVTDIDLTKHLSHAAPNGYDFIFIDSVNSHKLGIHDFIQLKNQHPHKTFILILQSTKDKSYRGTRDWEHEVDNVIYLEPNKAEVTKSRFLLPGKNEIEIPDLIGEKESVSKINKDSPVLDLELAGSRKRSRKKEEKLTIWATYDFDSPDLEKTALKHDPDYKSLSDFYESNPGGLDNLVRDILRHDLAQSDPSVEVLNAQFQNFDRSDKLISFGVKIHGTRKDLKQVTEPNGMLRYDWDSHED
jgi:hypothetical protein